MSITRSAGSPIDNHLRSYEESWKADYEQAQQFWAFQENLQIGIAIFGAIQNLYEIWRQQVSQGLVKFSEEDEKEIRGRFEWWLRPCGEVEQPLRFFEKEYGSVEGSAEFLDCRTKAKSILETWIPPMLSKANGLHAAEFSQAEATKLNKILESGEARIRTPPRPL
jgi:hypothetical protein